MEPSADALIAVVEDDDEIRRLVVGLLSREGYRVEEAQSGADLDAILARSVPELVILDLMLPGEDGLSICRRLRGHGGAVPILMLTAKSDAIDRVVGLEMGADDYLTKPFDLAELLARLRALVRRAAGEARPTLAHGGVVLDPASKHVTFNGQSVTLSAREYALLDDLLRHKNHIRTRAQLEESIYAWGEETGSNTVEVFVHHLRKKFGADFIRTVRGLGYQLGDSN